MNVSLQVSACLGPLDTEEDEDEEEEDEPPALTFQVVNNLTIAPVTEVRR